MLTGKFFQQPVHCNLTRQWGAYIEVKTPPMGKPIIGKIQKTKIFALRMSRGKTKNPKRVIFKNLLFGKLNSKIYVIGRTVDWFESKPTQMQALELSACDAGCIKIS